MESLYSSTRDDLRQIAAERDLIEEIITQQHRAQTTGYGNMYPNAYYFIVEKLGDKIGRIVVDIGDTEVRLVDIAFIPLARGKGYGAHVLRALQQAAAQCRAPLALTVNRHNLPARNLYLTLGFRSEGGHPMLERMVWYPATT